MKFYLQAFFILFFIVQVLGQRFNIKLVVEGKQRECIIVKPSTPPPPGGYPVVFMLHGTSGDGEKFYNISGWKELGERENFITVFPSSLAWCFMEDGIEKNNTKWVCGDLVSQQCIAPQNFVDDVKFLKKIVSIIKDTVSMNASKVFACGFSNGCGMIHKLAMDAGDVFAAVAGSSGALNALDSIIPPIHRIPIWLMVGNLDDRFIVPPFVELPFGRDSILGYLHGIIFRTLACQGLSENFIFNENSLSHTYTFNESQSGGLSKSPFLFTLNKGQIHEFPNGSNYPVNAPELFWEFFKQSTVVATKNERQDNEPITTYPNPSNAQIHVNFKTGIANYNLKIMNCFGQTVYQEDNKRDAGFILDKKITGTGLFILQIQIGNKLVSKKILFE